MSVNAASKAISETSEMNQVTMIGEGLAPRNFGDICVKVSGLLNEAS